MLKYFSQERDVVLNVKRALTPVKEIVIGSKQQSQATLKSDNTNS